jgi:hypothetical protein
MSIRAQWKPVRIVHAGLMASVVMYAAILVMITQQPATTPLPTFDPMIAMLIAAIYGAITLVGVIPVMQRAFLPPRDRIASERVDLDDPQVAALLQPKLMRLRTGLIFTWALCESVAVGGLVIGLLFRSLTYFLPFGAVALLAMLYHAPTESLLASVARAARRG